ncbi:MAG: MAPEG family protein [Cyanobacteria bacterium J06641_5]
MTAIIVPTYAALIALMFVALSFRTIFLRVRLNVLIGAGEDRKLARAVRVHSNFAEYVPLALILIFFLELQSGSKLWIHIPCISLLMGRVLHAYGVSQVKENTRFRLAGMILTLSCIISTSARLIIGSFN